LIEQVMFGEIAVGLSRRFDISKSGGDDSVTFLIYGKDGKVIN